MYTLPGGGSFDLYSTIVIGTTLLILAATVWSAIKVPGPPKESLNAVFSGLVIIGPFVFWGLAFPALLAFLFDRMHGQPYSMHDASLMRDIFSYGWSDLTAVQHHHWLTASDIGNAAFVVLVFSSMVLVYKTARYVVLTAVVLGVMALAIFILSMIGYMGWNYLIHIL